MTVQEWLGADNKLSIDVWNRKYRFNNESFDEWLDRISDGNGKVRQMILDKKFLYGGRILANLNTGTKQGVSNCVTAGYVEDSLEDIMDTAKYLAMSYKSEAGVGVALSKIRPRGARIGEKGVSDGVIGFLKIFNAVTENISRGNQRRGAMFCGLHCDHPDVMEFIKIKKGNKGAKGEITSANISVLVTDEFMEHYMKGESYKKDFIVESTGEVIPHIVDTVAIMNAIIDTPKTAFEPGIIFVDRLKEGHLFGDIYNDKELMMNACTEFYGTKGTVCLLGSMNLSAYVKEEFGHSFFDFDSFGEDVKTAIDALDKAHDYGVGRNGLRIQDERAYSHRGLGLGIMGLADMFMKLGIRYGSQESVDLSDKIAKLMRDKAVEESKHLGEVYGQPMGVIEDEKRMEELGVPYIKGLRNNSLLSIAPAGSISLLLNISTGIEPVFRMSYTRKTESLNDEDTYYEVFHKPIQDIIDKFGYKPDYCIDTRDVSVEEKVNVISAWQKYVDLSISNTTNFKEDATVDDIKKLYIYGWKKGVKGLTVYVDGSIEGVLNEVNPNKKKEETEVPRGVMDKVPADTIYIPRDMINGCGRAKVMIGFSPSENRVTDIYYIAKGQGGCSKNIQGEAILISQVLRLGGNLADIQKSFLGIDACSSCTLARTRGVEISGKNCPNILLKMVLDLQQEMQKETITIPKIENKKNNDTIKLQANIDKKMICPECGATLAPIGGCYTCNECGYSKCD